MEIQRPEAGDFPGVFEIAPEDGPAWFALRLRQRALRPLLRQNAAADALQRIVLAKIAHKTDEPGLTRWTHGDVLAGLYFIALFPQILKELALGHRLADCFIDVGADQAPPGRSLLLLGPPFSILFGFPTLRVFNDGQAVFPAQRVGDAAHFVIILFRPVIFDTIQKGHRIQHKVVVQMIRFIQMGGHDHLIPVAPELPGQLQADLMSNLRRGLAGSKGLIAMIGHRAVLLSKAALDRQHFLSGRTRVTVDAGDKLAQDFLALMVCRYSFGFLLIDRILDHIGEVLGLPVAHAGFFIKGGIVRFLRVLHIDHHFAEPALNPPDRSRRQLVTPPAHP